ncbi:diguanylate cyclase (GGDEF) domain-containing protein [Paenibacillus sp. UNCCL117]|uniref:sensor domain-containing diguanylate cyclase n=1 Tax=unclassified Paenibacillus TaxID=185978 RepID=UPI00087E2642|nr:MULTISPECIES: sensor domain-containing diguanylate cyclase [unclassified Paenibacillus]SDD78710.1 diguanylate cyclase (GGDEF) domain-containing protein [Paenibacillus sp. cl123]SFW53034.1 diguanylate cyclase (GGDEF) domain-containing protein [Paenibacillus sp. UNCCL117]
MRWRLHNWRSGRIRLVYLIIGLVIASMLGTTCIQTFVGFRSDLQSLSSTTLTLNVEAAAKMSATLDSMINSMNVSLKTTAAYLAEHREHGQALQQQLDLLRDTGGHFNSLFVLGSDGIVEQISPSAVGIVGQRLSAEAIPEPSLLQQPYISKPYRGLTNRMIMLMTYPIFDQGTGQFLGLVGGSIYLQESNVLNSVLGNTAAHQSGSYVYVVDQAGHLIYHPETERLGDNVSSNKVVQKVKQGLYGSEDVINTQGNRFLAGYSPVKGTGWGIIVQSPYDGIYQASVNTVKRQAMYSLPFWLTFLLVVILIARLLTVPFTVLSEAAEQISKGKRVSEPPFRSHWNYEANQLNKTTMLAMQGLQDQAEHYAAQAKIDPLTGLTNRRTMDQYTGLWVKERRPFAMMTLDIDRFKAVNDTYGHQAGDEVLRMLAARMGAATKPTDICCRYGGEEFVILLPDTSREEAYRIAEQIRSSMAASVSPTGKPVTVSIGVAGFPSDSSNIQELFQFADRALYQAKQSGRNRVVVHGRPHPPER